MKTLAILLFFCFSLCAQNATVQFIHNSPDSPMGDVTVRINNNLTVDSLSYFEESCSIGIPADTALDVLISSIYGAPIINDTLSLNAAKHYIGIISGSRSAPLPQTPFKLGLHEVVKPVNTGNINVGFYHSGCDVSSVSVKLENLASGISSTLSSGISYGDFSQIIEVPQGQYKLTVANSQFSRSVNISLDSTKINDSFGIFFISGLLQNTFNGPRGSTLTFSSFNLNMAHACGNLIRLSQGIGIHENVTKNPLTVYPIPVTHRIKFNKGDFPNGPTLITITDVSGKIILNTTFQINDQKDIYEIDVNFIPTGAYVLQLKDSSGKLYREKITK